VTACSVLGERLGEDLAASAPKARRFLLLEQPGPCPPVRHRGLHLPAPLRVLLAPLGLVGPATVPQHGSLLFSRNLTAFVQAFTKDQVFQIDLSDDIQRGAVITHEGDVKHAKTQDALQKVGT